MNLLAYNSTALIENLFSFLDGASCSGIDHSEKTDYSIKSFPLRSALRFDISSLTLVWLHLFCHTRNLLISASADLSRDPRFNSPQPLRISLSWFAWACIVVSELLSHQDIYNTSFVSGGCFEPSLFCPLGDFVDSSFRIPRKKCSE